jgi:hypothetical protein
MDMKTPTIEDLLQHPSSLEITVGKKSLTVYVRSLTQVEQELSRGSARRASRDLRRLLEDTETEEHQLLVKDELEEYEHAALKNLWITNRLVQRAVEAQRESLENREQGYIPEPDENAMPADLDRYENDVDDMEDKREKNVQQKIVSIKDKLDEEVDSISVEVLREDAITTLIDNICAQTFNREFAVQMVARGTFNDADCTKPTFKASSEVKRLRGETLEALANAHYALMVDPEAIKN